MNVQDETAQQVLTSAQKHGLLDVNAEAMFCKTDPKPLRVFLQGGSHDLNNQHGNWPLANQQMDSALRFMKYDRTFLYGEGTHNGNHGGPTLPDSLRWLWRSDESSIRNGGLSIPFAYELR